MVCKHLRPLHHSSASSHDCRQIEQKLPMVSRAGSQKPTRSSPLWYHRANSSGSSRSLASGLFAVRPSINHTLSAFSSRTRREVSDHPSIHPSIHLSMAATGPAFLPGSLFDSFSNKSRSPLGKRPWKALGVASALSLGSLTSLRATGLAERRKAALDRGSEDALKDAHWPSISAYVNPFASLSLDPQGDVVEPKTGVVFPGASPEGKQLTGVGLRKKSILGLKNITVYAYGLYADPDSLRSTLSTKYENFTQAELGKNEKLFADVTESDVGLTVRLVIIYKKLKIGSIRSAFEDSVGKGLKKFSGGDDNKELLLRFTNMFTDDLKLPQGTTIDISRLPGQVLQTKIDGQEIGSVQSSLLCRALFDLYIGDDAFDKPAKEVMGAGFASLLCD